MSIISGFKSANQYDWEPCTMFKSPSRDGYIHLICSEVFLILCKHSLAILWSCTFHIPKRPINFFLGPWLLYFYTYTVYIHMLYVCIHTYTIHTVYVYVLSWLPRNLWFEVCRFSLVVVCSLVVAYGLCFWILVPCDWVKSLSRVRLFATPWTVAYQAPPSMGFSRLEYWSGLPFPSPRDLPNLGIKPGSPALHSDAFNLWATREAQEQGSNPGPCPGRWILNHWTTREFPTIFNFIHGLLHNYDSVSESCSVVSYSL